MTAAAAPTGWPGGDFVEAREPAGHPRGTDAIDCGAGVDRVYFDEKLDTVANCEDTAPVHPRRRRR